MEGMDEIVHEFLVESYENLDQLDQDLVALESAPTSRELLSSIFRTVHTIKGTSGFLGYANLERVSHTGENLLAQLRDGARSMDQPTTDVLLALVDTLRAILGAIEAGRGDDYDVEPTITRIVEIQEGPAPGAADAEHAEVDVAVGQDVEPVEGTADPVAESVPGDQDQPDAEPAPPPAATAPVKKVIGRRKAAA